MEPYIVHCLFCRRDHRSFYWDELEEEIMRCREKADTHDLGLVSQYQHAERIIRESVVEEMEGPCFVADGV